jgi:hypothetical protein
VVGGLAGRTTPPFAVVGGVDAVPVARQLVEVGHVTSSRLDVPGTGTGLPGIPLVIGTM